jgi:ELP3 family radical SAM enzyme/protein acetyltransferase
MNFNDNECTICTINIKTCDKESYDFLKTLIQHVEKYIVRDMFDDPLYVNKFFQKLLIHCTPKGQRIYSKQDLIDMYKIRIKSNTINYNFFFEKLVFEDCNGELCVSCPSKALQSCPYECAFCPTEKSADGKLIIAKSYTPDQTVFKRLLDNNNDLIRYLLQHMINQSLFGYNVGKLAMRHLGGTFHSYDKKYLYTYSRDIFYCANILHDIIENEELLNEAKLCLYGMFDPNNKIISQIRKVSNYDMIDSIENKIEEYKLWGDKFEKDIQKLENMLLEQIKLSLNNEQTYNELSSKSKIVSYSIETRPDQLSKKSIEELLKLGVTIVELGLQSPDNNILKIVKRGHTVETSIKAIRMLKDNGLHVHGQWMMDLPSSNKEIEIQCINAILSNDLRCDQIKIYPHLAMPGTETKQWLDSGFFESWVDKDWNGFLEILKYFISNIDKSTRIVRIQRDLPQVSNKTPNGYTNNQPSNLEQIITKKIYKDGLTREDIRFHEPGLRFVNLDDIKYYINVMDRNGGKDIFISAESYVSNDYKNKIKDFRVIWGYCRLAIPIIDDDTIVINFFKNNTTHKFGRIRELKVNGSSTTVGMTGNSVQHLGIGTNLLKIAEELAYRFEMTHVTVTSAVGVRQYYMKKHNYMLDNSNLMYKKLNIKKYGKLTVLRPGHMIYNFTKPFNYKKFVFLFIVALSYLWLLHQFVH